MKITIYRKGKMVTLKCEGDFPNYGGEDYIAGNTYGPVPYIYSPYVWFGSSLDRHDRNSFEFIKIEDAKNSFKKTKEAALDYKSRLKELRKQ